MDFKYLDAKQIIINKIDFLLPICKIKKISFYKDKQLNIAGNNFDNSVWKNVEPYMSFDSLSENPIIVDLESDRYFNLLVIEVEKFSSYQIPLLNYYSNVISINYTRTGDLDPGTFINYYSLVGERHSSNIQIDFGSEFRDEVAEYINNNYPLNVLPYTNLFPKEIKDKDAEEAYENSYKQYFNEGKNE